MSLSLLPRKFRQAYAAEMTDVFLARREGLSWISAALLTLDESLDVAMVAVRMHAHSGARLLPRATLATAVAMTILLVMAGSDSFDLSQKASRVDIDAHDPAGHFTLSLVDGRPVAMTMNRVALPMRRVVYERDSIRVFGPRGKVALAIAYHRRSGQIEWKARPSSCRSSPIDCDLSQ